MKLFNRKGPIIIKLEKLFTGGITLYPFIFIRSGLKTERLNVLINHERIHLRQQLEMLVIPFYIVYLFNYLFLFFVYKNHNKAYRNIIFEREAFLNEYDLNYLQGRKWWQFFRYIKKPLNY
jgi:hypothetical protein